MRNFNIHKPLPPDNAQTPEEAIVLIRNDTKENLYIYKNEKQMVRFRGDVNRISISETFLRKIKDSILVHNHPQGSPYSMADIKNAIQGNVKAFFLVTYDYLYSIDRPINGWEVDFNSEETKAQLEESRIISEDLINKMIARNELSLYEANNEINHYLWSTFFCFNGISYVRKRFN